MSIVDNNLDGMSDCIDMLDMYAPVSKEHCMLSPGIARHVCNRESSKARALVLTLALDKEDSECYEDPRKIRVSRILDAPKMVRK